MNRKFGRLVDGQIEYAPKTLDEADGVKKMNPSDESYLALGWKRVVDVKPPAESSRYPAFSSWREDDETLTAVYKMIEGRDPALGVRVFSKLKMVMALKKADLWILTRTWIEENGLYDLYLAAQDFREDNEFFIQGKSELQRLSGRSAEEIEAILSQCVAE